LCPNEHIFCHSCVCRNLEYRGKCPQCNVDTPISKYVIVIRPLRDIVDNLEVYCLYKNNGCNQTMMRNKIFDHIKVCPFMNKKCESLVLDINGETKHCSLVYHIDDQQKHIHCRYAQDGCRTVCSKNEIVEHEKQCHYYLLAPILNNFKNRINCLEKKINCHLISNTEEIKEVKGRICRVGQDAQKQIEQIQKDLSSMKPVLESEKINNQLIVSDSNLSIIPVAQISVVQLTEQSLVAVQPVVTQPIA
jgi:hypothetical protein